MVGALLALVLGLQIAAIEKQSLIGDAPYLLLAGHQALRYGQNTLNLTHPPLTKLITALPLMGEEALAPPLGTDEPFPTAFRIFDDTERAHRVRRRSRAVALVAIVLPLFVVLWWLGHQLWGPRGGAALLAFTGLSFCVVPYLTTMQTDGTCTLGYMLVVASALSLQRRSRFGTAALMGLGLGIAATSKFTGLFLLPAFGVALLLAPGSRRHRLALAAVALLCAAAVPGAVYSVANRHMTDDVASRTLTTYVERQARLGDRTLSAWVPALEAVSAYSPSLAQYTVGVLGVRAQNRLGIHISYAFGDLSSDGRWWYFPVVLAVKLPLALIAVLLLAAFERSRGAPSDAGRPMPHFLLLCALVGGLYMAAAMTSTFNLGVRHLLPVVPLLLLPAIGWAADHPRGLWAVAGILSLEALLVAPAWMSTTNTWWLGDANPTRAALSHSNFETHQNFISLARVAEARRLEALFVLYPGLQEKELTTYSSRFRLVSPGAPLSAGAYAVSASIGQLMPKLWPEPPPGLHNGAALSEGAKRYRPIWSAIRETCTPKGWVAGTFELFHCEAVVSVP